MVLLKSMLTMLQKIKRALTFASLLKLELYLALVMFSRFLKSSPLDMLIQDKLCRIRYNMSHEFCKELSTIEDGHPDYKYKTQILSDGVNYNMYHNLISMIPGVILPMFLGPWTDRYVKARKIIFMVGSVTMALESCLNALNSFYFQLEPYWILVSFIPYTLSGSVAIATCYTYLGVTTPRSCTTLRMTVMEIILAVVEPVAIYMSGSLINKSPVGGNGQIHNYGLLFSISSAMAFVSFLCAFFMIDEQRDRNNFLTHFATAEDIIENRETELNKCSADTDIHPLRLLFDLNNVRQMIQSYFKKRPNHLRTQIWLLQGAMFFLAMLRVSPGTFLFQFTEKVYEWDSQHYSYVNSFIKITNSMSSMLLMPILLKVFKLNDIFVAIIGYLGFYSEMMIRAVILSPLGFYVSIATSCATSLANIGIKSHFYKIIAPAELGKIYTMIGVVDSLTPICSSTVFASIFRSTIDDLPGTCFLILSFVATLSIIISMIIDYIHLKSIGNVPVKLAH